MEAKYVYGRRGRGGVVLCSWLQTSLLLLLFITNSYIRSDHATLWAAVDVLPPTSSHIAPRQRGWAVISPEGGY